MNDIGPGSSALVDLRRGRVMDLMKNSEPTRTKALRTYAAMATSVDTATVRQIAPVVHPRAARGVAGLSAQAVLRPSGE